MLGTHFSIRENGVEKGTPRSISGLKRFMDKHNTLETDCEVYVNNGIKGQNRLDRMFHCPIGTLKNEQKIAAINPQTNEKEKFVVNIDTFFANNARGLDNDKC